MPVPKPQPKPQPQPKPHCPAHGLIVGYTVMKVITHGGGQEVYCPRCYDEAMNRFVRAQCQLVVFK